MPSPLLAPATLTRDNDISKTEATHTSEFMGIPVNDV